METVKHYCTAASLPAATLAVGTLLLELVFPGSVARWVSLPALVFGSATIAVLGFFFEKRP